MMRRLIGLLGLVCAGCGGGAPVGPSQSGPTTVNLSCLPVQVNLQCTVTGEYSHPPLPSVDLTRLAQWSLSNPAIATVSTSGFVTVLGHGELDIIASYANYGPQTWSVLADPQQPPQVIYFLSGIIRENDGTDTRVPDAVVEILDGYNAGRAATSNQLGTYNISRVLTKVSFTVRASKPGYVASTTTYQVDGPTGLGNAPFLDFRLTRIPATAAFTKARWR